MAKISFVDFNPISGNGNQAVTLTGDAHTGRSQRTLTVEVGTTGGEVKKEASIVQAGAVEGVTIDNTASVAKTGGEVTINGTSNSTKLKFELTPDGEHPLTLDAVTTFTANSASATNDTEIDGDPGAGVTYNYSVTFSGIPANTSINDLITVLKVTAAGGQTASCTITQSAGDPTLDVTPTTINMTAEGVADSPLNITSNTSWTIAQRAGTLMAKMMKK